MRVARKLAMTSDRKWPRAVTSRLPKQLTFKLEGTAARAVLPVDNVAPTDCRLAGSRTHTRGHEQPLVGAWLAAASCPQLKLTCSQQKRRQLVEPFIIET